MEPMRNVLYTIKCFYRWAAMLDGIGKHVLANKYHKAADRLLKRFTERYPDAQLQSP